MKYVSIIISHYSLADDFGEQRVKSRGQEGTRSEMMRETLFSLAKNTDYPAEIIVVDNGGPGDDSEFLLDLTKKGVINTYVRNKNNMHFGWAWNQGAKLATGDYLCFTCNDIAFHQGWLTKTITPLLKYPEKKLIGTPLITPDKDKDKFMRGELDGHRLNTLAGSNCMVMHKDTYEDIGEFSTHSIAGTHWHQKMNKKGYLIAATPENMATHLAHQGGFDVTKLVEVKKELLNNEVIDYSTK